MQVEGPNGFERSFIPIGAAIGLMLRGSIAHRSARCGQPTCRCKADPPRLHGPFYLWTRKVAGKTVTAQLTSGQAARFQDWSRNMRRLDRILRHVQRLACAQLSWCDIAQVCEQGTVARFEALQRRIERARVQLRFLE